MDVQLVLAQAVVVLLLNLIVECEKSNAHLVLWRLIQTAKSALFANMNFHKSIQDTNGLLFC
jgi:hypothetical protein